MVAYHTLLFSLFHPHVMLYYAVFFIWDGINKISLLHYSVSKKRHHSPVGNFPTGFFSTFLDCCHYNYREDALKNKEHWNRRINTVRFSGHILSLPLIYFAIWLSAAICLSLTLIPLSLGIYCGCCSRSHTSLRGVTRGSLVAHYNFPLQS